MEDKNIITFCERRIAECDDVKNLVMLNTPETRAFNAGKTKAFQQIKEYIENNQ